LKIKPAAYRALEAADVELGSHVEKQAHRSP
jgi:hypothetical protein